MGEEAGDPARLRQFCVIHVAPTTSGTAPACTCAVAAENGGNFSLHQQFCMMHRAKISAHCAFS